MTPLQETIIEPTSDMRGWSAQMLAATFALRAPLDADGRPQLRFTSTGTGWRFDADQLDPILATLREASRWLRMVWRYDPGRGQVFGPSQAPATRYGVDGIEISLHLIGPRPLASGHVEVSYTDLHQLRTRLQQRRTIIRRRQRKAPHDLHTH